MMIKAGMLPVPTVLAVLVNNWGVEGSRRLLCGLLLRQQVTLQPSKDTACLCDASLSTSVLSGVYPHFDGIIQLKHGFFNPYRLKTNKLDMTPCLTLLCRTSTAWASGERDSPWGDCEGLRHRVTGWDWIQPSEWDDAAESHQHVKKATACTGLSVRTCCPYSD